MHQQTYPHTPDTLKLRDGLADLVAIMDLPADRVSATSLTMRAREVQQMVDRATTIPSDVFDGLGDDGKKAALTLTLASMMESLRTES